MLEANGLLKMPFDQLKFTEHPLHPDMSQISGIVLSKADVLSLLSKNTRHQGRPICSSNFKNQERLLQASQRMSRSPLMSSGSPSSVVRREVTSKGNLASIC